MSVAANITISGVLRGLGLSVSPGNFRTLAKHIARLQLDTSHFKGKAHGTTPSEKVALGEMLKAGTYYSSGTIKRRLLKEQLLRVLRMHDEGLLARRTPCSPTRPHQWGSPR